MASLMNNQFEIDLRTYNIQKAMVKNLTTKGVTGLADNEKMNVLAEKILEVPTTILPPPVTEGNIEQEIIEAKYFSVQQYLEKQISDSYAITKDWTDYSTARGSLATYFPEFTGAHGGSNVFQDCINLRISPKIRYGSENNFSSCFGNCKNLIEFNCTDTSSIVGNLTNMFSGCSSLVNVDFKGVVSPLRAGGFLQGCSVLKNVSGLNTLRNVAFGTMFGSCTALNTIDPIDFTNAENEISIFNQYVRSNACTTIVVKGTINVRNLWWANNLSIETLRSIIAALTDRVGQTALVITLTTSCTARLTVEDTLAITNKNWTLATVV